MPLKIEVDQAKAERILNPVPETVSRFQAKAALHQWGLLEQVQDLVANSDDVLLKLAWDEASFNRSSQMIANITEELGLTGEQVDDLFRTAAQIKV